ncbi:MAG: hypothetical protein A2172_01930 [Candidatus Woykebacteria bacterium RBG_13_40_15]|uniref:Nudix hydrolase domain-containing protein n=1 Tax=Candidatus Woykebacteria bacterium RBG_13_40_15 TaxID=1802593 RepID=A0A1G1W574_9BACT|nr:MAG: hypothetical protein A2172_01930 [Candidatus Woykebacteria bacterium RBG_13_40_15]
MDNKQLLNCKKCGFVFWNNPKPVVSTLIEKDGNVLMLKRAQEPFKGHWVLPGGFVDYDEEPEAAAIREFKEEAGLNIQIESVISAYRIGNDPRGVHIDIVYVGRAGGKPKLDAKDFAKYGYFPLDRLPDKIAYKHREVIINWRKWLHE